MDDGLSENYGDVFDDVIEKVKKFGGVQPNDTIIKIVSNLHQEILLKDHTRVVYEDGGGRLPESHNGLGYMNLISMIFEIESIRRQFARQRERKPADINFLVIEEPEAHTHPQMQYIFIKNIKQLLKQDIVGKDDVKRKIQSVVTTHSAHIVAECDFEDLKYLKREDASGVISKNMTDLEKEYADHTEWFKFLKQYITLDRSELFFADKAIFVEGDTERILMPSLMKISDDEMTPEEKKSQLRLTSQNISIVSVGNYTHIFTRFFNFIGFKKICVITDLDICNKEKKTDKNSVEREVYIASALDETKVQYTTNSSLSEYIGKKVVSDLRALTPDQKTVSWDSDEKKWKQNNDGNLMVCYQTTVDGYQPRSFEDAFFATNKEFMKTEGKLFFGLDSKALERFMADEDCYELANKGIKSKATFAVDLLVDRSSMDEDGYVGWQMPQYIKEGLSWIRKD
jgi:predicted ATP-dependent endonuclease of OLD family